MFSKMPVLLVGLILLSAVAHPLLPLSSLEALYAVSLTIKSLIAFLLPFIIFGLLFKTAIQLSKKASYMVLGLIAMVCLSNYLSTTISYGVGTLIYHLDFSINFPSDADALRAAWDFSLPKLIPNDVSMFMGMFLGLLLSRFSPEKAEKSIAVLDKGVSLLLKAILYVIPLFIFGFILKMEHDKILVHILRNFTVIFAAVALAVFSYITLLYYAAGRFQKERLIASIKNMLPAAIAGFGSMSSAAVMPLTLIAAEKNSKNPTIARSIIPATVNIHLIGDCFAIPIFAFAVMKNFGMPEPSLFAYAVFAAYFVLAKFSVAAVPGGGILVMLPILESQLGFNAEMLSLMTALYILFDPVITSANVLGNGAFAMGVSELIEREDLKEASAA